jgi:hypothetical protein
MKVARNYCDILSFKISILGGGVAEMVRNPSFHEKTGSSAIDRDFLETESFLACDRRKHPRKRDAMTDARPFDPALFNDAAIDPDTAKLNA